MQTDSRRAECWWWWAMLFTGLFNTIYAASSKDISCFNTSEECEVKCDCLYKINIIDAYYSSDSSICSPNTYTERDRQEAQAGSTKHQANKSEINSTVVTLCNGLSTCKIQANITDDKECLIVKYKCIKPSATCPDNVTECADDVLQQAHVSWEPANVYPTQQASEFKYTPSNGSLFPIGETIVNATANITECSYDTVSCSFSVFVEASKCTFCYKSVNEECELKCGCPSKIQVIDAQYYPFNSNICNSTYHNQGIQTAPTIPRIVTYNISKICDHLSTCQISESFPDAFRGLLVQYRCIIPSATCPDDANECADDVLQQAHVSWESANVHHTQASEFIYTPSNGSLFPIGETIVNATANITECSNDIVSCSFSVLVEGCTFCQKSGNEECELKCDCPSKIQVIYAHYYPDNDRCKSTYHKLEIQHVLPKPQMATEPPIDEEEDVTDTASKTCDDLSSCTIPESFPNKFECLAVKYRCIMPSATCPDDVTECADDVLQQAHVLWEPANVHHTQASEFKYTPSNGSLFPVGETIVNATANITECSNDTVSCSFSVFVEDCMPSSCNSNESASADCILHHTKQSNSSAIYTEFEIANGAAEMDIIMQHSREITEMDLLEIDNPSLKGVVSVIPEEESSSNYSKVFKFSNISVNLGFNYTGEVTVVALFWEYEFILTPKLRVNITGDLMYFMNSGMLSVSAYDVNENPINTNVDYIIQVLETDQQLVESLKLMNYNSTYVCGFIDLETQEWSTSGCYVAITDVTVCRCNHLTSFAVLMQVTSYEPESIHEEALSALTTIGLIMSIILLTITETVYVLLKGLWKSLRNNIHKNLIANMIAFYTFFLIGIDKTHNTIFCKFTSVALHLLLMNIFFWMFGEAVFLVFKVVYRTPSRYNRLRNYMLFCYLVPVILVSPVAIVMYDSYGNDYCWLDAELTWIILIPATILVLFSMAVLIMMVNIIYRRAGTNVRIGRTEQEDHRQLKKSLKGALFLVPILGVTWIFGPLMAVTDGSLFMQYLFVILNSLQGVFIFIVYCLLDNEVQAQWKFMRKSSVHTTESTQTTL